MPKAEANDRMLIQSPISKGERVARTGSVLS